MAGAWELWTLAWLGILQFLVGYWWYRGPHLPGTRAWVPALFGLNGLATAARVASDLLGFPLLGPWSGLFDRLTNVALLAIPLVAVTRTRPRLRRGIMAVVSVAVLLALPAFLVPPRPRWSKLAVEGALFAGIILTPFALQATSGLDEEEAVPWLLVLAGLGIRFSELSTIFFDPAKLLQPPLADPVAYTHSVLRVGTFPAMVAALGLLVVHRLRDSGVGDTLPTDVGITLVASGFLLGWSRSPLSSLSAVLFTLAFVRPLIFLAAQDRLTDPRSQRQDRWLFLGRGALVFGVSLLGLGLARLWDAPRLSALGIALGIALLGVVLARSIPTSLFPSPTRTRPPAPDGTESVPPGARDRDWPVDPEDASLPEGWRGDIEDGLERFQDLPPDVRGNLADLAHWERILLALDAAPEGDRLPPYERSTPGLHFVTHVPYASIGSEIRRTNDRSERIRDEVGLPDASPLPTGDEPIVSSRLGPVEGLESSRAKAFWLTALGEEIALALRSDLGLEDHPDEDLLKVLGSAYADGL